MSKTTYEVETVFYNTHGGVKTKNCDLFSSKKQAVSHMLLAVLSVAYS